jgi:hypothetical protein
MFYPFSNGQLDIVRDGLVLWLDAGDRTSYPGGGTTWRDLSLGGNNGTLNNGPNFSSANGGSIVFDGVDDFILVNNGLYVLTGGTLNIWVKRISGNGSLIGSYGGSGAQRSPTFYTTNTNIGWEFGNLTAQNTGIPFTTNKWFNLSLTYDNNYNVIIYIDGNPAMSQTAQNPGGFWNQLTIGRYGNFGNSFFNGNIPIVQIYNRALSASEVLQNYNATKDRFIVPTPQIITDGLFMELDAANYTSGAWADETGNGNNATVNGATWLPDDGGIFDLDGISDSISIPHVSNLSLNTTTQRTIQVWVKFGALPALNVQVPVFGKLSSSFAFDGYWGGLFSNGGQVRVVTNGNALQRVTTSTLTVTTNVWYLFTFISQITAAENTTKVYINETEYGTAAHGSDSYSEANPLYLGYIGDGVSSQYLNGKIGGCYFYTRGLSAAEVSDNFNATKSRFGL